MALYRIRAVWSMRPGIPSEQAVWSWGVDAAAPPDAAALRSALTDAMGVTGFASTWLRVILPSDLTLQEVAIYPAAGGEAVSAAPGLGYTGSGGTSRLPTQIAAAVSSQIDTVRGTRPKGRTFYGPFVVAANDSLARPTAAAVTRLGTFSTNWHNALVALGAGPVVLSGDGLVSRGPILTYAVDNSWDTMRSRKADRTTLTTFSP